MFMLCSGFGLGFCSLYSLFYWFSGFSVRATKLLLTLPRRETEKTRGQHVGTSTLQVGIGGLSVRCGVHVLCNASSRRLRV